MQLLDALGRIQVAADQLDLLFQALQVDMGATTVLGDDFVAGAVVADVRAERHMHVQRQRSHRLAAVAQGVEQVEGTHLAGKLRRSRVRGVARPRYVVAADQVRVPTNGVEHAGVPRIGWHERESRRVDAGAC